MAVKLLDGVTADGKGPIIKGSDITQFQDRRVLLGVRSTNFGGGTVTVRASEQEDEASMMAMEDGAFTESQVKAMIVQHSWYYQAELSGATSPEAVTVVAGGD